MTGTMDGPLSGAKVIELAGIGPAPFAAMMLAELGAEVVRIDRPGGDSVFPGSPRLDLLNRGKRSIVLDLKKPKAVDVVLDLVEHADVLIEGYRPGVAERLGVGPDACWERNQRLVFGRMTGWGQDGPWASMAGHDLDYIALTGALHAIGMAGGPPQVPLNLVGDFGGGGVYLVVGVLAAMLEAGRSGHGQVVDAAIVDGAAHLLTGIHAMVATGTWLDQRGVNLLDGGAPFYRVYETADGRHMAVGAIENRFYRLFVHLLGLDDEVNVDPLAQLDTKQWSANAEQFAAVFRRRSQAEWAAVFEGSDACVAPVASLREAVNHPHVRARASLVELEGILQSAPAPRFSRSRGAWPALPPLPGEHTRAVLHEWLGLDVATLLADGTAAQLDDGSVPAGLLPAPPSSNLS